MASIDERVAKLEVKDVEKCRRLDLQDKQIECHSNRIADSERLLAVISKIASSVEGTKEGVIRIEEKVKTFENKVDNIGNKVNTVNGKVDSLDDKVREVENKPGKVGIKAWVYVITACGGFVLAKIFQLLVG